MQGHKLVVILVALLLIAANVMYDHYAPPTGMELMPLVATLCTGLVVFSPLQRPVLNSSVCATLLALQDIGFKLWGGGLHDVNGQLALNFLFLVGAFLSAGLLAWALWRETAYAWPLKVGAFLLFSVLLLCHLLLFENLGRGL